MPIAERTVGPSPARYCWLGSIHISLPDLLGFLAVIAVLAVVGRRAAASADAYLVADRSVGLWALVATLVMTEFNTSTLLAFSATGYSAGPMAIALPLVFLVGLMFYTVTVARHWKRFNRLSVAEYFSERYSPALGRLTSALLLLAMIGFSATYVKSLTLIFVPFLPALTPWVLSGLLTLVVLAVVISGGLPAIVRADVVGFGLTIVILPVLLFAGVHRLGPDSLSNVFPADQRGFHPFAQWNHPVLPFRFVITLMVLTCFTYISAPWYGQKIFSARDERTAFRAVALSSVLVFVLYGATVLAAAMYRAVEPPLADAQTVVPAMIARWLPSGARGVGTAMLFSAALTTLAGVWSAMTAMVVADFGGAALRTLNRQRVVTVLFAVVCWLGANLLVDDILNRLILANIPVAALAFALLAGFHWPRATTAGAWASVAVGVLWGTGCFIVLGDEGGYTWPWAMYGIPLIIATGVVGSLLTQPVVQPRTNRFE